MSARPKRENPRNSDHPDEPVEQDVPEGAAIRAEPVAK
jgi:hypothetical protein